MKKLVHSYFKTENLFRSYLEREKSSVYCVRQKRSNKRAAAAENVAACALPFSHRMRRTLIAVPQCAVL